MKRIVLQAVALCAFLLPASLALGGTGVFSFGVILYPAQSSPDDPSLRDLIDASDAENLAFVVSNGIKSEDEPCSDTLYQRRKTLLQSAKNGLIVSLAARDWTECRNESGRSTALGRLNRLRELFFMDEYSLGATRIPLIRQSTTLKYRNFVENARWEIGDIMFATINLPANNNHYVSDAGRNSEFEDRQVANRAWLDRLFTFATREKAKGVVLFSDGNPLVLPNSKGKRDGFAEIRKQITVLAKKFPGRILLVSSQTNRQIGSPDIHWHDNLGELNAATNWVKLNVDHSVPALFLLESASTPDTQLRRPVMRAGTDLKGAPLR